MELEQGIRKILNLIIYEGIGAHIYAICLYEAIGAHIYAICLYKLVQWDLYNVDLKVWENLKRMNFMTLLED